MREINDRCVYSWIPHGIFVIGLCFIWIGISWHKYSLYDKQRTKDEQPRLGRQTFPSCTHNYYYYQFAIDIDEILLQLGA